MACRVRPSFRRSIVQLPAVARRQSCPWPANVFPVCLVLFGGVIPLSPVVLAAFVPLPAHPASVAAAITAAKARFGRIDIVVNNAGYANVSPIETGDDADFRAQFETNFWGVYHVSKAAIPVLREQGGGVIMQFSSVGGRVGGVGATVIERLLSHGFELIGGQ